MRAVMLCSLLSVLLLFVYVDGQRSFTEVIPTTEMWTARDKANVELVRRTTTFRDGISGRPVTLTDYMLLYGGSTDQGGVNDVWASSNGRAWAWVAGVADGQDHPLYAETFPNNEEAAHCQDTQYRQYRAGGRYPGEEPSNDVWMSADGMRWQEQTPAAEWEPRYLAGMVGDSAGAIYIAGGILVSNADRRTTSGEVWRSTNQGRVWRQINTEETIASGAGVRAVSLLLRAGSDRLIWMTGVNSGYVGTDYESYYKDVWASTNQGRNFYPVNLNTPFGRRDDANGEITDSGLVILAGGYAGTLTGEIYNDVWVSPNGGYTWGMCVRDAEWDDRRYQMTLLDIDGFLWVMGGSRAGRNQDRPPTETQPLQQPLTAAAAHSPPLLPSCALPAAAAA